MGTAVRQSDPGHITFSWYPQLVRTDLGIGPHRVWWISRLEADAQLASRRGAIASVDARSYARPDEMHTTHRRGGVIMNFKPTPGVYAEQVWLPARRPTAEPRLTLRLTGVAALTVDTVRAGLATLSCSTITVTTDCPIQITLDRLPDATITRLDRTLTGMSITVPPGRHRITLAAQAGTHAGGNETGTTEDEWDVHD